MGLQRESLIYHMFAWLVSVFIGQRRLWEAVKRYKTSNRLRSWLPKVQDCYFLTQFAARDNPLAFQIPFLLGLVSVVLTTR